MSTRDKKRAAEETANRLRDGILRGVYPAGSDLPGERELSTRLGVSRLTLRAALARLEAEGLVRPVHGSGNRVLDFRDTGGVELLGHLLAIATSGEEIAGRKDAGLSLLANLLELRRFAAVEAVGFAAERATAEQIAELRAHVEHQAQLLQKPEEYVRADLHYARLLTRATGNFALSLLANTILRVLEGQQGIALTFFLDPPGTITVYRRMVDLIESRDAHAARAFTRRLIGAFDRGLLQRLALLTQQSAPPTIAEQTAESENEEEVE
jgi:GntR family transcriptional regulator, transcriptional repressor for pyruvate dehydrogenase complex